MPKLIIEASTLEELILCVQQLPEKLRMGYYQGIDYNASWDLEQD